MDDSLYQERILEHYEEPFHRGRCPQATHGHEDDNPLCGDHIRIELRLSDDGRIEEAYFDGDGCCISQAATSMLLENMVGKTLEELGRFGADDMLTLFGPRLTPNRQKCCLLSWRVLKQAIHSPLEGESVPGKLVQLEMNSMNSPRIDAVSPK